MSADDTFNLALRLDAMALAHERREDDALVHLPVDEEAAALIINTLTNVPIVAGSPMEVIGEWQERLKRLRPARIEALAQAAALDRKRTPWRPMRGSQCLAFELASEVDVLLLGGGAGSGKSELAVCGIGLFQGRVVRVLRKTSLEFTPLLRRLGEVLGTTDGRNLSTGSWEVGPPFGYGGRGVIFEFTSLNDPDSMFRLQGRPCDTLIIDDAGSGQISREDITFVSRWVRSTELGVRKKTIYTSNPVTGRESLYLRDELFSAWLSPSYAGKPAQSGEVRCFLPGDDGGSVEVPAGTAGAESRAVVLSKIDDNPRLLATGYKEHLARSPSVVLRKQLLEGDWSAGWDTDADFQVIPSAWIDAAMERWTPTPPADVAMSTAGVDVARGGRDRTTIAPRYGDDYFAALRVYPGSATPDGQATAGLVLAARGPNAHVFIDVGGIGAAPFDLLKERIPGKVTAINFGASSGRQRDVTQSFEFANIRSLTWWRLREALDPNGPRKIALPPDKALRAELTMPHYELRSGRLYVESRDEIIKRLHRSPDLATAVVLAAIPTNSTLAYVDSFTLALQRNNARWAELQRQRNLKETTS